MVGVEKEDSQEDAKMLAVKISNLRIFQDKEDKMNLNIKNIEGEILSVPQFTLCACLKKGNRPSFDDAAPKDDATFLWKSFNGELEDQGLTVKEGVFGDYMQVELTNDGPVTILMDSRQLT